MLFVAVSLRLPVPREVAVTLVMSTVPAAAPSGILTVKTMVALVPGSRMTGVAEMSVTVKPALLLVVMSKVSTVLP